MESRKKHLTDRELEKEIEKIMNGEDDMDLDSNNDIESDWEEADNLEVEHDSSDSVSDFEENEIIGEDVKISEETSDQDIDDQLCNNPSASGGSSSDDNIPLSELFATKKRKRCMIKPKSISLKGKNGHKWSTKVPQRSKRTARRNIVHFIPGSKGGAKTCSTFSDYFLHFFSDDIVSTILCYTNDEIRKQSQKYTDKSSTVAAVTKEELMGLFGILIMSAVKKDNHLNAKQMFDSKISGSFYKGCMSCERFLFLINCLRFDNKATREERVKMDAFAHIRDIWDIFIEKCRTSYIPSSYLTLDEQLLGFRGRCPFRMYIPSKPSKYGMKIVMLCDSSSKYMVDACPYLGKQKATKGVPLSNYYVQELTKSVHGSNRNITMDNWFTSVEIADKLLDDKFKLTIIGTLRKNKREIPPEMLNMKGREPNTSMFCFDKNKTLVSYMPKKTK